MSEGTRAQVVEMKLQRAQSFFAKLDAEDIADLRHDPQIASHLRLLARELQVIASAVGPEPLNLEEAEGEIV